MGVKCEAFAFVWAMAVNGLLFQVKKINAKTSIVIGHKFLPPKYFLQF